MNILAFDTTLGACSAAIVEVGNGSVDVVGRFELRERQHAENLIPMIEAVLADASLEWRALDAIAVTSGPGSFTGVRVGVATARGLALALDKPVISASSLDVMAHQAAEVLAVAKNGFAVAVDARRGEVYFAHYDETIRALSQPAALTPRQAADIVQAQAVVQIVGSGARLVREACAPNLPLPLVALDDLQPDARTLARMALDLPALKAPLRPLYLRPPDAKPQTGKAVERRR